MATESLLVRGGGGLLLIAVSLGACGDAHAGGFFNLPSTFCQCFGYGYGPGYHAPLALQNPCVSTGTAQPILYSRFPPKPPACPQGFCGSVTALDAAPAAWGLAEPAPAGYFQPTPALVRPVVTRPPAPAPTRHTAPAEPASPSDTPQPETIPLPRQ